MNEDENEDRINDAVEVFSGLIRWIGRYPYHARITQRKVIAALLVVAPTHMSERSVAQVCRRLGISRQTMDAACRRFRALLPVLVSGRRSPMQRKRIADGVKEWHARHAGIVHNQSGQIVSHNVAQNYCDANCNDAKRKEGHRVN